MITQGCLRGSCQMATSPARLQVPLAASLQTEVRLRYNIPEVWL
jgi:hypothetical protein